MKTPGALILGPVLALTLWGVHRPTCPRGTCDADGKRSTIIYTAAARRQCRRDTNNDHCRRHHDHRHSERQSGLPGLCGNTPGHPALVP